MLEDRFAGSIASGYQAKWPHLFDAAVVEPAVDFLVAQAGPGPVLELGIGTGRLALPLARRGIGVHGIELSPDMVAQLRAQEGGGGVGLTMGDIATSAVAGGAASFTMAYIVRNTIMNLTTQDAQVSCFCNVAAHLVARGRFVMEVMVPELRRLPPGDPVRAFSLTPEHLGVEEYDVATQTSWSHHAWVTEGTVETFAAPFRYVWPAELDLMARLAGMALVERWEGWDRAPFTSESRTHVSVWEKRVTRPR